MFHIAGFRSGQIDDAPAFCVGLAPEAVIGIDRYRVIDQLKQRQIIVRVAVEPAIGQGLAVLTQPGLEPRYLSVTITGCARYPAGKASINLLRFGGQEVVDAECAAR